VYDTDATGNIIEMQGVDGVKLVLDSIWEQISHERCAQFCGGYCLSRYKCAKGISYCYPVPVNGKRPNKIVAVMFTWYCVDVAEDAACAAADAARAVCAAARAADAADAARAARAADAARAACAADAARAAYTAARAADAADAARAAYTACAAARAADAACAAADAARAARAATRDGFYLAASHEIERLVAAWGTPIKETRSP